MDVVPNQLSFMVDKDVLRGVIFTVLLSALFVLFVWCVDTDVRKMSLESVSLIQYVEMVPNQVSMRFVSDMLRGVIIPL